MKQQYLLYNFTSSEGALDACTVEETYGLKDCSPSIEGTYSHLEANGSHHFYVDGKPSEIHSKKHC